MSDVTVVIDRYLKAAGAFASMLVTGFMQTVLAAADAPSARALLQALGAGDPLGTPASGTLTNCAGLPVAGVTSSTATALGVGSIELGHASDTTMSRVSPGGRVAVEGVILADALDLSFDLTTGEPSMPRIIVNSNAPVMTNGLARFTFFTAKKTETITQVATTSGSTAQVGATLCRIGVYSVDASDNLTLIASTANDTTLWLAATTEYVKTLSASFNKVRGTRYAICELEVGTSTAGTLAGTIGPIAAIAAKVPRLAGTLSGQTDLQSSVAVGSLTTSNTMIYAELRP